MATLIKVDKNGTKYWADDTCQRCGGAGASDMWRFTGCTCYECGGSGRSRVRIEKEYTPEYMEKLMARRAARAEKKLKEAQEHAEETRREWLHKNQFDENGNTYKVMGDTYAIKDDLKVLGAKYDTFLGWHSSKPLDGYTTLKMNISDIATATIYGYVIEGVKVQNAIEASKGVEPAKESEYIGNEGEKVNMIVTLDHIAYWESIYGTTYVYTFTDEKGNVIVWKTAKGMAIENGEKITLTGTIKEHSEYKGVKQTVLTRCKINKVA